jgi:serine/threonine protein kinase
MSGNISELELYSAPVSMASFPRETEDYREILNYYGLTYIQSESYWQVGQINHVQGWLLHLSVVISQISSLLESVIFFLTKKNISFKIPLHKGISDYILNGYMGTPQVGKIVSIYPESSDEALALAKELIILTNNFKGPAIPTDICLGGVVYTRYGSFSPVTKVNPKGRKEKYIYDNRGKLIKDPYSIPFQLPKGISWPFREIASPIPVTRKKILNNFYKPQYRLKSDARGNVYKGQYVKGVFQAAPCIIKQGKKNMGSENCGRDIRDKLLWQQYLYMQFADVIPFPRVIDFFEEQGDSYLVIELIKGTTLHDRCKEINFNLKAWRALQVNHRKLLVDYLLQILSHIDLFHQYGFVHRDIQPSNFLIDDEGKIFLIDVELAWSIKDEVPNPPFELGTAGFMSPEQFAVATPTFKEDIYGFSGLMISVFTGLSPAKFNMLPGELAESLQLFIENSTLTNLIAACRSNYAAHRPELTNIKSTISEYRKELDSLESEDQSAQIVPASHPILLKETIIQGLAGLNKTPIIISEDLWYSKDTRMENRDTPNQKEFIHLSGMREGVAGVLYLLAVAKRMGYPIEASIKGYYRGYQFILDNFFGCLQNMTPGLHEGAAGIAIALSEGVEAGLLDDDQHHKSRIQTSLILNTSGLNVASGAAGQGIAILRCARHLDPAIMQRSLQQLLTKILSAQKMDGSWIIDKATRGNDNTKSIAFAHGVSGIIWFLLEYLSQFENTRIQHAASKGLKWLCYRTKNLDSLFDQKAFKKLIPGGIQDGDERIGVLRTFIKAYEVLGEPHYRSMAEKVLEKYPLFVVTNNFTQETGLAGLGELYLEAKKVFGNDVWQDRVDWIAQVFVHTANRSTEGTCYWQMEENGSPTADLLLGNSGILHFLMRCTDPETLGHCLLN